MPCTGIFGWALEPFKMSRISALATSILIFVSQSRIKALLVLILRSLFTILLGCLPLLALWFLLFVLASCLFSVLVMHEIDLGHLGVPCHLLDVSSCCLWTLHFLGQLAHLACRELVQIHAAFIYGFRNKVLIFQKKHNISLWSILASLEGIWQDWFELV